MRAKVMLIDGNPWLWLIDQLGDASSCGVGQSVTVTDRGAAQAVIAQIRVGELAASLQGTARTVRSFTRAIERLNTDGD